MANNKKSKNKKIERNTFVMKILVILGVFILLGATIYLMNYFFVERSYIKINMSTDKQLEYIKINGKDEMITTQKYVSDLGYTMRYDINNFKVFKYKSQDIFKFLNAENILIRVEGSSIPTTCNTTISDSILNSCMISIDNYTTEYYVSNNSKTYRLTVKRPNKNDANITERLNYMLNSFEITNN